ncbi:hypothetical protein SKAU_G00095140 [Synaphobranchus kaupii]|uniref:Uncharacterized protein n=1 Tax=Synaphobranchus kaupii TaxID=118154 RepID=A0A9Q1FYE0_SYNKA|nr:hypothetical protein SKAU_G00415080 [Synaphobranchus kaupii]KAJ8369486.1 hypothetical protein SKAU_G00095140 [Synaphobranchus kaupii]
MSDSSSSPPSELDGAAASDFTDSPSSLPCLPTKFHPFKSLGSKHSKMYILQPFSRHLGGVQQPQPINLFSISNLAGDVPGTVGPDACWDTVSHCQRETTYPHR